MELKKEITSILDGLKRAPKPILLTIGAGAVCSLLQALSAKEKLDSSLALWLLAIAISAVTIAGAEKRTSPLNAVFAWGFCLAAFGLALLPDGSGTRWSLALASCALLSFFGNWVLSAKLALPSLLFWVLIPDIEILHLVLSMPLGKICASLASVILNAVGLENTCEQAVITIGASRIAVTAACSGVELLEAMLLLTWIIVYVEHRKLLIRAAHFLMLPPVIIFFNTVRLTGAILLSQRIGDKAFQEPLHTIFGCLVVVFSALSIFLLGRLFKAGDEK